MTRSSIVALCCCALLAGCGGRAATPAVTGAGLSSATTLPAESARIDTNGNDWPEFRRDNQRTGNNPYQTAITAQNVGTLLPKWTKPIPGVFASAVVVNGVIYQGDLAGNLNAWKIADGTQVWTFKGNGPFIGTPYYDSSSNTLYVGDKGGTNGSTPSQLLAIDASTGKSKWAFNAPNGSEIESSPMLYKGVVYIGNGDKDENKNECDPNKQLVGVSAATGKLVSSLNIAPKGLTGADIWASPMLDPSNNLYVATGNECATIIKPFPYADAILHVNPAKPVMHVDWAVQSIVGPGNDVDFGATPLYVNGMIVDTGKDGYTYAIDPSGKLLWHTNTGAAVGSSATDGVRLYIPTEQIPPQCSKGQLCGEFEAVNLSDGSIAWSVPVYEGNGQWSEITSPAVSNGVVYGAFNNGIWGLDAATGKTLWNYTTNATVYAGIAIVNGGLLVGDFGTGTYYDFTPNGK